MLACSVAFSSADRFGLDGSNASLTFLLAGCTTYRAKDVYFLNCLRSMPNVSGDMSERCGGR